MTEHLTDVATPAAGLPDGPRSLPVDRPAQVSLWRGARWPVILLTFWGLVLGWAFLAQHLG